MTVDSAPMKVVCIYRHSTGLEGAEISSSSSYLQDVWFGCQRQQEFLPLSIYVFTEISQLPFTERLETVSSLNILLLCLRPTARLRLSWLFFEAIDDLDS